MQEPQQKPRTQEVPETDHIALANAICGLVLTLKEGQSVNLPHSEGVTKSVLRRWLPTIKYRRITIEPAPGGTSVTFHARKAATTKPAGRPKKEDSIRARLLEIGVGATAIWRDVNPVSLSSQASTLRKKGLASFRITYSDQAPPSAKVERIDGLTVTDGYGRAVRIDKLAERSLYPFRTMQPGDRFTVLMALHTGVANMRATCSKFGKLCGYVFTCEQGRDGSITVECGYRKNADVTEAGISNFKQRKSKPPQLITLIW
jgi:hypothetical protein